MKTRKGAEVEELGLELSSSLPLYMYMQKNILLRVFEHGQKCVQCPDGGVM